MPLFQNQPYIISNIDSYKNTTMLDTNQQMVALQAHLSRFYTDFKYADSTNFTGKKLYNNPKSYLRLPAAKALQKAVESLKAKGLTVKIYDAYRPYTITKIMWNLVHDTRFTANSSTGSNHNRGIAIDLTLCKVSTGTELKMPTAFDDFTVKASHNYKSLPADVLANRALLKSVMEQAGFTSLSSEWWHYTYKKAGEYYDLLDISFDELARLVE